MKRTELKRKTPLESRSELARGEPLKRKSPVRRKRSQPRRSERVEDAAYRAYIQAQPCLVVGCRCQSDWHHYGKHPKGRKCDDRETVPICFHHHIEWFHQHGHLPDMTPEETRELFKREGGRLRRQYEE